jgi:hypothetical protein
MTRKLVGRCLFLACVFSIIATTATAQQPSGGRRTELEYLDRGFDLEGITSTAKFPDTAEGRAKYEQYQLGRFQQNVEKLSKLGKENWVGQYDSISDRGARRKLENMAEDLGTVSEEMIKFFEWRFQVEPLKVDESAGDSVRERVAKITPMVEQILRTVSVLTSGGIPVKDFVEMRENLARIHMLSRSLRN